MTLTGSSVNDGSNMEQLLLLHLQVTSQVLHLL